jgi:hypothetical protein
MRQIYSENFAEFWSHYPRHTGKGDAWKAFQKLAPSESDVQQMIDALAWQVEQPHWRKDGGQYIPYAGRWLRARQWEDEPFHVEQRVRYTGWECPHTPPCEQRHWCSLRSAKEAES